MQIQKLLVKQNLWSNHRHMAAWIHLISFRAHLKFECNDLLLHGLNGLLGMEDPRGVLVYNPNGPNNKVTEFEIYIFVIL